MKENRSTRRQILLGTTALIGLAGCSGLGEEAGDSPDPSADENGTVTTTEEARTETDSSTETATGNETDSEAPGYLENHWHGRLFFEIDGDLVDFDQPKYYLKNIEDDNPDTVYFHFHESAHGPNEWSNEKKVVTFQRALNLLPGIEYEQQGGEHVVTYEGTRFDGSASNTDVSIHRGTEQIDPTTYEVEHDDNFWVSIQTEDGSDSSASERTGKLIVDVNNRRLNAGGKAFEGVGSDRFEFRDDGERYTWYNTGDPVTLEHALDVLPNVEYSQDDDGGHVFDYGTNDSLGGTYHDSAEETEIIVRQRTTPVDPTTYELQNGDIIWVYVHTSNAPDNEH
jgi:hypothetical protein